jgi:copper chaperone CopZ
MDARTFGVAKRGNIVHHVPGRLRIKVKDAKANVDFFSNIKKVLGILPGVNSVRVNPLSSSIVIDYPASDVAFHLKLLDSPEVKSWLSMDQQDSITAFINQAISKSIPYSEQHSRIAEVIVSVAEQLDIGLRKASNGYLDLKLLLPLGIAVGTSLHKARGRGTPMWITLSTFAFNSFLSMHHQRIDMPIVQIFPARRA